MSNIFDDAKSKTGLDISKMKKAADEGKLDDFLNKNLSVQATQKLRSILNSKEETEKLLSSPQAQELMKKFGGK